MSAAQNIQVTNLGGQIGSYAISTVAFDSWINQPTVQSAAKARKTRATKEVVHKIFQDCATITTDPFWIEKFTNASINKFPPKFSYRDGLLIYKKGAKSYTLEVSSNVYEAAPACVDFMRFHGSLFSPIDERYAQEMQTLRDNSAIIPQDLTWKDSNKKVQECMLSYYMTSMKEIMSLTAVEADQLRQTVKLGLTNKFFGNHNIVVTNNRIMSIGGLLWNAETRTFYIDPTLKPISARTYVRKKDGPAYIDASHKDMVPQFTVRWMKYLESLDKKMVQHNRMKGRINIIHTNSHIKHGQSGTDTTTNISQTCDETDEYTEE